MIQAGLKVSDAAHADGSQDVSGVVYEAFGEVVDAADFDAPFGVNLEDPESSSEEGRGRTGSR